MAPPSRAEQHRVVLAVDGNSLVHRSYHSQAGTGLHGADGDPIWAVRGLLTQLVAAVDRFQPDVVVVGFDDPDVSWRREKWPQYKANRSDKLPTLVRQLEVAADVLRRSWRWRYRPRRSGGRRRVGLRRSSRRRIRRHHCDRYVRSGRLRTHRRGHTRAAHHQRWRRVFAADHRRAAGLASRSPARSVSGLRRVTR